MTFDEALSAGKTTFEQAMGLFDAADAVDLDFMTGTWRGLEFPSGHRLDGLMEAAGWYGKRFVDSERVHPLLFYTGDRAKAFAVDPAKLPMNLVMGLPLARLPRRSYHGLILAARPLIQTQRYKARLRMTEYRGRLSATMIYDDLAINDVFRRVDADTLLGAMDMRGDLQPYFFVLRRDESVTVV